MTDYEGAQYITTNLFLEVVHQQNYLDIFMAKISI